MKLVLHEFELKLNTTFKVSREAYASQKCLIVELALDDFSGYGEASAFMVDTYHSSIEEMKAVSLRLQPLLKNYNFSSPQRMWSDFYTMLYKYPFLQCAWDVAAYDLWAKIHHAPLSTLLGIDRGKSPKSSFSLGIDTAENTIKKFQANPYWPEYKIKLGHPDEMKVLKELRKETPIPFLVDVNCGWSLEKTLTNLEELHALNVTYIEEPLKSKSWDDYKILKSHSFIPIIADESCASANDLEKSFTCFHGINIKLMKAGGITPALQMIKKARENNMIVMLGCMPESSVGVSAIAQLAPLVDRVDLDSLAFITNDIAVGVTILNGTIVYNQENGTGAQLL